MIAQYPKQLVWFKFKMWQLWRKRIWRHHLTKNSNSLQSAELLGGISLYLPKTIPCCMKEFHLLQPESKANLDNSPSDMVTFSHFIPIIYPTCLVPHIYWIFCTLYWIFHANSAQTNLVEIFTEMMYKLGEEQCHRALLQFHSFVIQFEF